MLFAKGAAALLEEDSLRTNARLQFLASLRVPASAEAPRLSKGGGGGGAPPGSQLMAVCMYGHSSLQRSHAGVKSGQRRSQIVSNLHQD